MAYGSLLTDTVQSSTANTPPQFNDGNGTQVGTLCRAWVNFNGNSGASPVIRASFNVSSVTRNSTGFYTITYATALTDVNYATVTSVGNDTINNTAITVGARATTTVKVIVSNTSGSVIDDSYIGVSIFR